MQISSLDHNVRACTFADVASASAMGVAVVVDANASTTKVRRDLTLNPAILNRLNKLSSEYIQVTVVRD